MARMNAPWRKAEKEGSRWQTAHILNCLKQFSSGLNGLIGLAEQKPYN